MRCEDESTGDVEAGAFYLVDLAKGGHVGYLDDEDDDRGLGERTKFSYDSSPHYFTVFRREESASNTAQLIEQKRAELAELEAKLAEESTLSVGDYARVVNATDDDTLEDGDIVKVSDVEEFDTLYPFEVVQIIGRQEDALTKSQLVKITPAEARSALIAQVEALFTEAV